MISRIGYLNGSRGYLFCSASFADARLDSNSRHIVLIIPPLLEEMNRARRLITCIRNDIARQGSDAIVVDLLGTGDSAGELSLVRWKDWCIDTQKVVDNLYEKPGSSVSVIGIRSGCLLMPHLFRRNNERKYRNIVCIARESSGEKVLRQWLRNKVIKQRISGDNEASTVKLWDEICRGSDLSYAGYTVSSELCAGLRETSLLVDFPPCQSASRIEFVTKSDRVGCCTDANGWRIHNIQSQRFWMQDEYVVDPKLVHTIVALVS